MQQVKESIPGYTFGAKEVPTSPVSLQALAQLKISVGFTQDDVRYLALAGDVLADQTKVIVAHWRSGIIASIPHLARHSRDPDAQALPEYLARSNRRFEQWILDTCRRPYDQDWLNYQQEIALRHTSVKKNQTDQVKSTLYIPLRDIIAFVTVMNDTIKPYLGAKGHTADDVEKMHKAWRNSMQLQIALFAKPYSDSKLALDEW
jgi:protoglobin